MTDREQEQLLRAYTEALISDFPDANVLRRRIYSSAMALDCPSVVNVPQREMAEKFKISRQAIHKQVDNWLDKIIAIKGDSKESDTPRLTPSIQSLSPKVNSR